MPEDKCGEEPCAWVGLETAQTAAPEDIREFCRVHAAYCKVPRFFKFVDRFPMTVTGKVQKYLMREEMNNKADSGRGEDGVRQGSADRSHWSTCRIAVAQAS